MLQKYDFERVLDHIRRRVALPKDGEQHLPPEAAAIFLSRLDGRTHGTSRDDPDPAAARIAREFAEVCDAIAETAAGPGSPTTADLGLLLRSLTESVAEAMAREGRDRQERTSRSIAEYLSVVGHDIGNHLSTALLALEIFKMARAGDRTPPAALEKGLNGMRDGIARLLSQARLEAKCRRESLRVVDLLHDVRAAASPPNGARIALGAVDRRLVVVADAPLFTASVGHLLHNAVRFGGPGGTVSVEVRMASPGQVVIDVADECGGLPERVDQELSAALQWKRSGRTGLGLGLATCLRAVETMEGRMSLRNRPGAGCVFSVTLPGGLEDPAPGH